jgi:uroporphyrinogen decarboxylase
MANRSFSDVPSARGGPDFDHLRAVLRRERPSRPTLFEFFLNERLYRRLTGRAADDPAPINPFIVAEAFRRAGYDYVTFLPPGIRFARHDQARKASYSLNEGALISDRASFEAYPWPDPDAVDYDLIDALGRALPPGMKVIAYGPSGVLENTVAIVGFENLCCLLADDPELTREIFDAVGSRLLRFYERVLDYPAVGAIIGNDDWGFKTQPMISPADLRRYVFPWHRRIVAAAHAAGRPAILHSCGNAAEIMDDVIDD